MKIIIDIQGIQSPGSRSRGIGRYTRSFVKSFIRNSPDLDYILFANSSLTDSRDDFIEELTDSELNVHYINWYAPSTFYLDKNCADSNYQISVALKTYALCNLSPDLVIITSFFEGYGSNCIIDFDDSFTLPPIVSIFYDLIPLLNEELYLKSNPLFRDFYLNRIKSINTLDGLLCISKSAALEAKNYLEIDDQSIYQISSACDKTIFNTSEKLPNNSEIDFDYLSEFILYTGAGDPRKNIKNLIEAYSLLSPALISKHKLVLAGNFISAELENINLWMQSVDLPGDYVILLGFVSQDDLIRLYQKCFLFVLPSFHEGFGLPILEAMSCGAPVIASNITSIPEVVDNPDYLFNPYDVNSIFKLIERSLIDPAFLKSNKLNSVKQSNSFSWDTTAKNTRKSIESVFNSSKAKTIKITSKHKNTEHLILLIKNKKNFNLNISDIKLISVCIDLNQLETKDFSNKRKIDNSKIWNIEGPFDSNYSLSILNRNFAYGLMENDFQVRLYSTEGPGDYVPNLEFLSFYPEILAIYNKSKNLDRARNYTSRNLYPPRVNDMESEFNILHAYGWEETLFPQEWVNDFNTFLDGITVMSNQVKKILLDSGVQIPIKVCGLGVDHLDKYSINKNYKINTSKFSFLHISSCFPRKGISVLLEAYGKCFSKNDDVTLIIKTFKNEHNSLELDLIHYRSVFPSYPNVQVIYDDLTYSDILALYSQSNCLIAPSFGEGFGLPIAEAMYMELPVITTNWGGQLDFCNHENSWLIDYSFKPAKTHFNQQYSLWAEVYVDNLSSQLIDFYNLSSNDIRKKTDNAKTAIDKFSWSKVAKSNIDFIQDISSNVTIKDVRTGFVSTYNSRCGIADYTKKLVQNIFDYVHIFAPKDIENVSPDENIVTRCWNLGSNNYDDLYVQILKKKITAIIFQFNFGLFHIESFYNLCTSLASKKIKVYLVLHSIITPDHYDGNDLTYLKKIYSLSERLFVHKLNDINALKNLGFVDNVTFLPHVISDIVPVNQYSLNIKHIKEKFKNNKAITLSSNGFCLPNKGFLNLIESLSVLIKQGHKFNLNLYTPNHFSDLQGIYFSELKSLVDKLNLHDYVFISNEYLDEPTLYQKLYNADILIYPYQKTGESSSASVRQGLVIGKPILVTPNEIFSDVESCVVKLDGSSTINIVDGIINLIKDINSKSIEEIQKESLVIHNWSLDHSSSKVASRLIGIVKGIHKQND